MVSVSPDRGYCEMKSTEGELIKLPFLKLAGDTISKTEKETRVNAEKNKLFPTETGKIVNRFLEEQFPELSDCKLTANIEDSVDLVASNRRNGGRLSEIHSVFSLIKSIIFIQRNP